MTQTKPKKPRKERIIELMSLLSESQLAFVTAMVVEGYRSKKDGAEHIGISDQTVYGWKERDLVYELIDLKRQDIREAAEAMLMNSVYEAAAVKVAGLRDDDPKIRQSAATEILDRDGQLGKPRNVNEITGSDGAPLKIVLDR